MKQVVLLLFSGMLLGFPYCRSQSVGIGIDVANAKAVLELSSASKGTLITRMTTAQRNANITGLNGTHEALLIYNTTDSEFNYWDGSQWIAFPGGDHDWYEFGTPPVAPDNINDNIYTNGMVGIGQIPTQSLHIDNSGAGIQSILVEDLAQTGHGYNPSTAVVAQNNRASVFVDRTTGIMYSEDANRAFWRLDGNSGVINAGYSASCPNLITSSMNTSGYEYLGTNDFTDLILATDDTERMRVLRDGQMVFYGKGIAVPASSPTGCVPAYPVIDGASFYGTQNTYPLNAYSENVPAVYGAAEDVSGGLAYDPSGVQGVIEDYGYGTMGISVNASSGGSVGLYGEEVSLNGWGLVVAGDAVLTGTPYGGFSDIRLKKGVQAINGGLDMVMDLKPSTFFYKEEYRDKGFSPDMQYGFIAQDIQQVFPTLVKKTILPAPVGNKVAGQDPPRSKEEFFALNQTSLIPILTNAIQEQQAVIKDQQIQLDALKAQNNNILARLEALEN